MSWAETQPLQPWTDTNHRGFHWVCQEWSMALYLCSEAEMGEGRRGPWCSLLNCFLLMDYGAGRIHRLQLCAQWWWPHYAPMDSDNPAATQMAVCKRSWWHKETRSQGNTNGHQQNTQVEEEGSLWWRTEKQSTRYKYMYMPQ